MCPWRQEQWQRRLEGRGLLALLAHTRAHYNKYLFSSRSRPGHKRAAASRFLGGATADGACSC